MHEADALCDVALETLNALLQESLLLLGDVFQGVGGLLGTVGLWDVSQLYTSWVAVCTYSKLDGDGEEVTASLFSNGLTSGNTGEVDIAGLYETSLALDGAKDLLSESRYHQSCQ